MSPSTSSLAEDTCALTRRFRTLKKNVVTPRVMLGLIVPTLFSIVINLTPIALWHELRIVFLVSHRYLVNISSQAVFP